MLERPSRAGLINAGEQRSTGISLRCFSKIIDVAPSDHSTTDITVAFVLNGYCISFLTSDMSSSSHFFYLSPSNLEAIQRLLL